MPAGAAARMDRARRIRPFAKLAARGAADGQPAAPAVAVADLLMSPATLDALRAGVMEARGTSRRGARSARLAAGTPAPRHAEPAAA